MPGDGTVSLDGAKQTIAARHAARSRVLLGLEILARAAVILSLAGTDLGGALNRALHLPNAVAAALYLVVVLCLFLPFSLGVGYARSFIAPRHLGLATPAAGAWLLGRLKHGLMVMVLLAAVTALAYWAMDSVPGQWWLLTAGVVVVFTIAMNLLGPVLLLPRFLKLSPLADRALGARLLALARKAGSSIDGIYVVEHPRGRGMANAMLVGTGRHRRIILGNGLTTSFSRQEVEVIVAHELGHDVHGDILRLMAAQLCMGLAGSLAAFAALDYSQGFLGLSAIHDIDGLPLAIGAIGAFYLLTSPLISAYMRKLERAADAFALELTGNAGAFVNLMTKLANQNLSEANPSRLTELIFYHHPTYQSRIRLAFEYRRHPGGIARC
ncbi:MAG: M48 family metalloprotease [Chloroflexi bacterium]|nr:M48 family metalloprotease [Chloroflexota bacterium]